MRDRISLLETGREHPWVRLTVVDRHQRMMLVMAALADALLLNWVTPDYPYFWPEVALGGLLFAAGSVGLQRRRDWLGKLLGEAHPTSETTTETRAGVAQSALMTLLFTALLTAALVALAGHQVVPASTLALLPMIQFGQGCMSLDQAEQLGWWQRATGNELLLLPGWRSHGKLGRLCLRPHRLT